ncbi:MAG: Flp pilus assembly protein CpaB [Rhodospirillaceae bacterium]|nr:Flp pilus assembly protein CpaB [Rhodospirillaceae bacterium]
MRKGVLLFAVIAFALTGGTIYFVNTWMKAERTRLAQNVKKAEPQESGVFVLVTAKALPAGHLIVVSDLRWQSWPDKSVPQQYVVRKDAADTAIPVRYVGTVVRRGIVAGGPVTPENLVKLGDRGFLAAVLTPGTRAITVRIDDVTGLAGLVYPGDRVDLILTHDVSVKGKEGQTETENKVRVSETILSNVRVIAIDQSLDDVKATKGSSRTPKTATLEVTPHQAEMIAVAHRMGTITLTLQSLACQGGEAQSASVGEGPNCSDARKALPEEPKRGKTYTADSDVSRVAKRETTNTREIFVIRGTEAKDKDQGVTVRLPPGSTVKQ